MNDERTCFALACRDPGGPAPVLTGVNVQGRLDALLFDLTLRQTYRNTSDRLLEVVYTFPLPHLAVLLGFAAELNGERKDGVVVARADAEHQYEESLTHGDAPVMLEAHGDGLHTANIGNLKPGDEIVVEARIAQLLSFEQGRVRVSIPTTIAPRYGDAGQTGLQPQQVPVAGLDAAYPLAVSITVGQALAGARLECPTHNISTNPDIDGSTRLDLVPGAWLDRDVVVIVTPSEPLPSLLVRADDALDQSAPVVMMAAMQPPAGTPRDVISIKLLVDCSSSMSGDSIASARAALRGAMAGLTSRDRLSLTRFGSTVEHLFAPSLVTAQALRRLQPLIDGIEADLGGTEMEAALAAVFELAGGAEHAGADVLIITDGEIWQAEQMVAAARRSGHRVFAIGVGSAPAEGVLRELAESTGGACDFATPGEALEAAARRMLHRMRQPVFSNVRVDWGSKPVWVSGPGAGVFGGDTVIAFAGFSHASRPGGVRLLASDAHGRAVELARGEADAPCPSDTLARVCAARRAAQASDADALALALRYQLMSKQTNCILVHRRAEADKADGEAELHRVSSMLAAGWGGLGRVRQSVASFGVDACMTSLAAGEIKFSLADDFDVPAFDRKTADGRQPASLEAMARSVGDYLAQAGDVRGLLGSCGALTLHADAQRALDDVVNLGLGLEQAWLLLAHWINTRTNGLADVDLATLLRPLVAAIAPALTAKANGVFDDHLASYSIRNWTVSRVQRLRRALGRIGT